MYCKKCGGLLVEGQPFCSTCGAQNEATIPSQPTQEVNFNQNPVNMNSQMNQENNNYSIPNNVKGKTKNEKLSLGFGIAALILAPLVTIISFPFSIAGIVFGNKAKKEIGKKPIGVTLSIISIVIAIVFFGISLYTVFFSPPTEVYEGDRYNLTYDSVRWTLDDEELDMKLDYMASTGNFQVMNQSDLTEISEQFDTDSGKKDLYDLFITSLGYNSSITLEGGTEGFVKLDDESHYAAIKYKHINGNFGALYFIASEENDTYISFAHVAISEGARDSQEKDVLKLIKSIEFK
jgi:hypothetical protein